MLRLTRNQSGQSRGVHHGARHVGGNAQLPSAAKHHPPQAELRLSLSINQALTSSNSREEKSESTVENTRECRRLLRYWTTQQVMNGPDRVRR